MAEYDVAVVGGGPIGLVAARQAARAGARTLLIERRRRIEHPAACTGLIGPQTPSILDVSTDSIVREIRGVNLHASTGRTLTVRAETVKAVVVDRSRIEQELLDRATKEGVEVRLGTEALSLDRHRIRLQSPSGTAHVDAAVLIGADGPAGRVAQWLGLPAPAQHLQACQIVAQRPETDSSAVDVYVGETVAPGFFAWAVPAEPGRLRIGVAVPGPLRPQPFLDRLVAEQFDGIRELSRIHARIPALPASRTVSGAALLVGDAAGQIKPLSGGGLYIGGVCARIAGRIAARAALGTAPIPEVLAHYEEAWRRAVGTEIAFGLTARELLAALSDAALCELIDALDRPAILRAAAELANIDHLSDLATDLAVHRFLWKHCLNALAIVHRYVDSAAMLQNDPIASCLGRLL